MPLAQIPNIYSAGTVDQWPKNVVCALLYGGMWKIPVPDLDRTDFLLALGANPAASQGSLLACPDVLGRIDAIRERGGEVVVVDPRRTKTADRADRWVPIQPGTDAALLAAMVHVLFAEDLVDLGRLAGFVDGVDAVRELVADLGPEAVAETTLVDPEVIRTLARSLATAEAGVVYGRIGTCNQEFGTLASWLVEVLNILTGNLDREGGSMVARPIAWSMLGLKPPDQPAEGWEFGRQHSRVRGCTRGAGPVPGVVPGRGDRHPGRGPDPGAGDHRRQSRHQRPRGGPARRRAARARRDDRRGQLAERDHPPRRRHPPRPLAAGTGALRRDDLGVGGSPRRAVDGPVFEPDEGRPEEWEILLTLAALFGGASYDDIDVDLYDDLYVTGLMAASAEQKGSPIAGRDPAEILAATEGRGPDRICDFAIRVGPYGEGYGRDPDGLTLERVQAHEHGLDLGPLEPQLPAWLDTPDERIDLVPEHIVADLPRLQERLERDESGMVLTSRRHLRSNNSWMHNVKVLVKGKDRCTLLVHPDDADRLGLADGGEARVASEAGSLVAPVEVTDDILAGVVSLPHGWGHDLDGVRLSVAREHAGVNNNHLAPGTFVDVPSGNAAVNGIPVEVTPA